MSHHRMKYSASFFLMILLWPFFSSGQGIADLPYFSKNLRKNSAFGNIGLSYPVIGGSASISYDRSILVTKDEIDIRGRLSIGYLGISGGSFSYQSLTMGLLMGKHPNHLEILAGAALHQYRPTQNHFGIREEQSSTGIFPAGNIGYRYQKLDGWFLIRAGIGFPDLGYVGMGVAF